MRILLLIDDYYPSTKSGPKLIHDLGLEMTAQGHQVMIATPSSAIDDEYEALLEDGLQVLRIKTGRLKGVDKIRRAYNEVRLSSRMWRRGKRFFQQNPCDLIVFYSPSIFFGKLVQRLKSLWNCPSYLILRDIFPKWAVDAGVMRKGIVYEYFHRRELQQYEAADFIGVESSGNLEYFQTELASKNYDVQVLSNWGDTSIPKASGEWRKKLNLENKTVFFYGGNIGVVQDMDNVVRLAGSLRKEENIYFLVVGEGSEVGRINRAIAVLGLQNIRILPSVAQEEYLAMLAEFDVGLISLAKQLSTTNIPGKFLGYLQCAKPVLASVSANSDLQHLIRLSGVGLCCVNGEDADLLSSALALASDPELRRSMGQKARALLEQRFSVETAVSQILKRFELGQSVSRSRPTWSGVTTEQISSLPS